jgi:hypothetical protein
VIQQRFRVRQTMLSLLFLFLFQPPPLFAEWVETEPGVWYQSWNGDGHAIHVTRIDLDRGEWRVIASDEIDRGLTVDEFAERYDAIVAINADYFDEELEPIGPARGSCGTWGYAGTGRIEIVAAFSEDRAEIYRPASRDDPLPDWASQAVAGWPMIIEECRALEDLPGSDWFTLAPHPRTAVGLSGDGRQLYFLVADGRREGAPGPTLPELAAFMREELDVCTAVNLDGGGSTQMVVKGETVNQPSDGDPRRVANHLAIVPASVAIDCEARVERAEKTAPELAKTEGDPRYSRKE